MEGRRIEGVLLETAILRNRAQEAYEASRVYEIKVLSQVPEALLSALRDSGGSVSALVKQVNNNRVLLTLRNGFEIEAENRLSVPVAEGDQLRLKVESANPLVFKVESVLRNLGSTRERLLEILKNATTLFNFTDPKGSIASSGVFYEKKVWEYLKGNIRFEDLTSDEKYKLLKFLESMNTEGVERVLREGNLPKELKAHVDALLRLLREGKKFQFFTALNDFIRSIDDLLNSKRSLLTSMEKQVSETVKGSILAVADRLKELGIEFKLNEDIFRSVSKNPKALDIIRNSIRDLESLRYEEFSKKLRLLGIEIRNADSLAVNGEKLKYSMEEILKASIRSLNQEEPRRVVEAIKQLREEIGQINSFKEKLLQSLSGNSASGVREAIAKLNPPKELEPFVRAMLSEREITGESVRSLLDRTEALIKEKTKELMSLFRDMASKLEGGFRRGEEINFNLFKEALARHVEGKDSIKDILRSLGYSFTKEVELEEASRIVRDFLEGRKEEIRELLKDLREMKELRENLSRLLSSDVKDSLNRLDTIHYLQGYMLASKGRSFLFPFKFEDGKGIMGFSIRDSYRIVIKLDFDEGFLGILIVAPRKEQPDYIYVSFKTNIEPLKDSIERDIDQLREELETLGLKVRDISVTGEEEEEFDRNFILETAGESTFNLRV